MTLGTTAVTVAGVVSPSINAISPKYSPDWWNARIISLPVGRSRETFTLPLLTNVHVLAGVFLKEDDLSTLVLGLLEDVGDYLQFFVGQIREQDDCSHEIGVKLHCILRAVSRSSRSTRL